MNSIYPPEPCLCGADDCPRCRPLTYMDSRVDAEVTDRLLTQEKMAPTKEFARDLGEALGEATDLTQIAIAMRNGDAKTLLGAMWATYRSYWTKSIRATVLEEFKA